MELLLDVGATPSAAPRRRCREELARLMERERRRGGGDGSPRVLRCRCAPQARSRSQAREAVARSRAVLFGRARVGSARRGGGGELCARLGAFAGGRPPRAGKAGGVSGGVARRFRRSSGGPRSHSGLLGSGEGARRAP